MLHETSCFSNRENIFITSTKSAKNVIFSYFLPHHVQALKKGVPNHIIVRIDLQILIISPSLSCKKLLELEKNIKVLPLFISICLFVSSHTKMRTFHNLFFFLKTVYLIVITKNKFSYQVV